ncbi:MAG TPA: ATP-dependent zinc metalloprotease FtsH [Ignavibacteriaceae bacterium]|nr:ATP-dependent zinc metalloprotease FtsH [Ignavibacteriaceae bacterium]
MENKKKNDDGKKYKQIPGSGNPGSWWKIFFVFLIIYFIGAFFFRNFKNNSATVPYSVFKDQVTKNNVASVTIKGQSINGKFNSKYEKVTDKDTAYYKYFATTIPGINDPDLIKSLEENNVVIKAEEEGNGWITYLLILAVPWILIIGYFVFINKKMKNKMGSGGMIGGGFFGIGKSKAKKFKKEKISVTFDDVAGLENPKIDLREIIEYLKTPEKFSKLGADIPKGVLLVGPPGTGKTLLARATAGEADVSFFSISGSEFIEMFVGVGASRVRDMFDQAKKNSPAVIFIDEIDSIGRSRGTGLGGGHDEREQTLNQILNEMDGFEPNESVVVMAATNRPDILDPALTRPGRFDRRITLDLPLKKARQKILEIHTQNVPLNENVDLDNIAARTVTFSGADIKNLVNEAALLAGRKGKNKVDKEDFDEARDKILLGDEREEVFNENEKKITAYHEAGHALSAILIPEADPLEKVTVIPRGRTLGATEQLPETERRNFTKKYLLARIAVALGGRAAEKLVFDDVTNGAASDLKQVTNIARKMVCLWGMSDKLGPVFYKQGEDHMFLGREIAHQKDFSENTQKVIDEEITGIIGSMEDKVKNLLMKNRVNLDAIAEALIENETLDKKQIDWILDKVEEGEEAEA